MADAKECIVLFETTSSRLSSPRQVVRCLPMNHHLYTRLFYAFRYPVALVPQHREKKTFITSLSFSFDVPSYHHHAFPYSSLPFVILINLFVVAFRVRLRDRGGYLNSSPLRLCYSLLLLLLLISPSLSSFTIGRLLDKASSFVYDLWK